MSDRALFNVAHTLSMTQTYVQRKGASFLFTVAPNKNSLYGENMPYYYQLKASDEKNLENLKPVLESEGVNYVDLYELLSSQDEVLYHKRDSHWNNKGAALAADTLLNTLGKDHLTLTEAPSETRVDYIGDLDGMLYPLAETPEEEIYYEGLEGFSYVEEVESNFDPRITTVNPTSSGSLVMFRDSFGNALLPFLAQNFANAYFTRGIPYQMTELDTHEADTVIVERAERFLPEMAENPPQMEGVLMLPEGEIQEEEGTVENLQGEVTGETVKISGVIEEALLEDDSLICIRVNGNAYEAFPATIQVDGTKRDSGFVLYLSENWQEGAEEIEVLVQRGDEWYKIYSGTL
jgi:hypothetical protein